MNVRDREGRVRTLLVDLCPGHHRHASLLSSAPDISLIGPTSLCQVSKTLSARGPAVTVLNTDTIQPLPRELIQDLVHNTPSLVLLSLPVIEHGFAVDALHLGVRGFIRDDAPASELVHAILCLSQGEIWASRRLLFDAFARHIEHSDPAYPPPPCAQETLTPREQEIVDRLCTGLSNKEIARDLNISDKTVKTHLQRIYKKNNVHSRLQLAVTN
ncbi:MAG: LuxR C-terminal-related transcriptional regulator [Alcanivorax sp.]|nr:LuxR C-terminal-related transcriptional regulator [Alcanivorax sp.]